MNYTIVSAVHSRPHIAEAWAAHLAKHFDGPVAVAGDDGEIRERMAQHLGDNLRWVPYCNVPLGAKWNRAAESVTRGCLTDHILVLGSDDFPSPNLLKWYEIYSQLRRRFTCLSSLYFHELATHETRTLDHQGNFGTGRMYPAADFRALFAGRGYAWEPSLGKGLDLSLWEAMGRPKPDERIIPDDEVWCVAVKTEVQIHSYEKLTNTLNMPLVETLPDTVKEFLQWLHAREGIAPARRVHITHN